MVRLGVVRHSGLLGRDRHRDARDFHIHRAEECPAGEVKRLPVVAAESDVGGRGSAMDDAAKLLALGIHDVDATGAAAIDIAGGVDLHPIGHARFCSPQVDEYAVGLFGELAVGKQIEGANVTPARVVDVEHRLVGREGEAIRGQEGIGDERRRAEIRRNAIDARARHFPWDAARSARGVGEIDGAVGFDDDVIRPAEAFALEIVCDDRDRAVGIDAHDALRVSLAGDKPPLKIAGQTVCVLRTLLEERDALPRRVLHAAVVADVAEKEIAALLPPYRAFRRTAVAAIALAQDADRL